MTDFEKVYLEGYLQIPDERIEAIKLALPEHIELTTKEVGCLSFEVNFSDTLENRLEVKEVFIDKTAFAIHQERTKQSNWFHVSKGIPRKYKTYNC